MNVKKYLAKGAILGLVNTFFSSVFAIAFLPVLVGIMGMKAYGSWALLAIFSGFAGSMDLGLAKSLVYFAAGKGKEENLNVYGAALYINLGMVLMAAFGLSCLWWFDIALFPKESVSHVVQGHLIICGSIILLSMLSKSYWAAALESVFKIHWNRALSCVQTMLLYTGSALCYYITNDLIVVLYYTAGIYFAILVAHIVLALTKIQLHIRSVKKSTLKKLISYSIKMYGIGLMWSCIIPTNRYLFVQLGGDMASYGVFDIAMKVASASLACLNAFSSPLYALFAGWGMKRFDEIKQTLSKRVKVMTALYLGGLLVFILFGKSILAVLVPEASVQLYYLSAIMIAGLCCYGPAEPYVLAFWALGQINSAFRIQLIAPVVNFSTIILLSSIPVPYRISLGYAAGWLLSGIAFIITFNVKYRTSAK